MVDHRHLGLRVDLRLSAGPMWSVRSTPSHVSGNEGLGFVT
jgi:hypothetical protein